MGTRRKIWAGEWLIHLSITVKWNQAAAAGGFTLKSQVASGLTVVSRSFLLLFWSGLKIQLHRWRQKDLDHSSAPTAVQKISFDACRTPKAEALARRAGVTLIDSHHLLGY